jgi:hypothetical protein
MLLERGNVVELGEPDRVAARYLELNFNRGDVEASREDADIGRYGDRRAEISDTWFEDEAGERVQTIPGAARLTICFRVHFKERVDDPLFGVVLADDRGTPVFEASNLLRGASGTFAAGDETTIAISFDNVLSSGRYEATPAIAHSGTGAAWIDRRERVASVVVTASRSTDAVLDVPFDIEIGAHERR